MALIEVYVAAASMLPINATDSTDIPQGSIVTLNETGEVVLCNGDNGANEGWPIGIAGDSLSSGVTSYTPESGSALSRNPKSSLTGSLIIGAGGKGQRFTQNHVSDNYNEVLASGKMTVYHSGGEFLTDQYEVVRSNGTTVADYLPGTRLFCSGSETPGGTGLEPEGARIGRFTDEAGGGGVNTPGDFRVGFTLAAPNAYPSGVPGVDVAFQSGLGGGEGGNSLSLGSFLHVKLSM